MPRSFELYLNDIRRAGEEILTYTAKKSFMDYESEPLLRRAVERLFEIIGEALAQARRYHPDLAAALHSKRDFVDFRNRVIHGYFDVNDEIIWSATKVYLPSLLAEVKLLLAHSSLPT